MLIFPANVQLRGQTPEHDPAVVTASPAAKAKVTRKLDGAVRARLIAALAGIAIFGFGIVLLAWLGGRMTRRTLQATAEQRQKYLTAEQLTRDDWADKPLTDDERQRIFQRTIA